jgi:redox-sensing transcriptional repressor
VKRTRDPEIPRKTVYRLSIYLRCLARLKDKDIQTVSSETLAKVAGVKSTQLRKDLTYFGQFGTRGLGYDVAALSKMISDELGTTSLQPVILVGVGNLGLALMSYRGFEKEGFELVAGFDQDPQRRRDKQIAQPILKMEAMPDFIRDNKIRMAILSVPAPVAQEVTNVLVSCGITGILNFSPNVLTVPEEVMVNNVNLAIELENLSYFIND